LQPSAISAMAIDVRSNTCLHPCQWSARVAC
jgi:hypothetical protein